MDLQTLLDEREITGLAVAYCWALDSRDWEALSDLFVPDATAYLGTDQLLEGREMILAHITRALTPLDASQHLAATHEVRVEGDTATHRCYFQAQHVKEVPEGSPNFIVAGRYEDDLVRTPDGWRIRHRVLVPVWTEGNYEVFATR